MNKIKCVTTESGIIIPIHNIVKISSERYSHYVWTAIDVDCVGLRISDNQYNALLRELEYIGGKFID